MTESSDAQPAWQAGQLLLGRYRCERILGEGGMGVVIAAMDEVLGRRVAFKLIRPELVENPEAKERLLREARAVAKLTSRHAAHVLDFGLTEVGQPYVLFEYLEGKDLAAVLADRGRLPATEAVGYVLDACEALAEAHSHAIVHRDLKPENLFCAEDADGTPCVKLLDFGVSKRIGTSSDLTLTSADVRVGSPNYMAPEQLRGAPLDARTDVWALGAVLYELVTNQLAFRGESVADVCAAILEHDLVPPSRFASDLPAGLEAVILRCLELDPGARFASMTGLSAALAPFAPQDSLGSSLMTISRMFATGVGFAPPPPAKAPATTETRRPSRTRRGRRSLAAAALVAAAFTAGAAVVAVLVVGHRSDDGTPEVASSRAALAAKDPAPARRGPSAPAPTPPLTRESVPTVAVVPAPPVSTSAEPLVAATRRFRPPATMHRPRAKRDAEEPAETKDAPAPANPFDIGSFGGRR